MSFDLVFLIVIRGTIVKATFLPCVKNEKAFVPVFQVNTHAHPNEFS